MRIFDWFKPKATQQSSQVTQQPARRPMTIDWTEDYNANSELTRGLYHNTYPGFKLAGGLAFPPIAVPVWFMGLPYVEPEDENDEETAIILDGLITQFAYKMQQIHIQCHREGTIWVWPHFSQKGMKLLWEIIPDSSVCDIVKDIDTGDIIKIVTDEQLTLSIGYNQKITARRKRTFTAQKIEIQWLTGSGYLPNIVTDKSMRNPIGMIPIPFSNNADGDEVRGHSDYERIISDLKNYHDIDLEWSDFLAKFKVKMVMEVQDVAQWLANNGYSTIADINVSTIDLIFNLFDRERITYPFPERAHEAYVEKLKQTFRKIVEASGVPEIVWGLKTSGNLASVEENMGTLIKFVHDKQDQKNFAYKQVYEASLRLLNIVQMSDKKTNIKITWDQLDAVSDEVRSIIFKNFAEGLSKITDIAALTKKQLYNMWKSWYPQSTDETFDEFVQEISRMASHRQWTNASYGEVIDFNGTENDETIDDQTTI